MSALSKPFARAKAMFAAIQVAITLPFHEQGAAFGALGAYTSHGHGEGCLGNKHSKHTVSMDKRAAAKARNNRRAG